MTSQEHLTLIDSVIAKRLAGDGYESYSEAEQQFQGASLESLYRIRERLQAEVRAASGANFGLLEPFSA